MEMSKDEDEDEGSWKEGGRGVGGALHRQTALGELCQQGQNWLLKTPANLVRSHASMMGRTR